MDSSISFSAGSRNCAKTLALQDMEKAWQESEADYFSRSLGCVAKLSQDSSFWKTCLPLLPEEGPKWSDKLPRWGMIVAGALYPLRPWEHHIKGNAGFYLPTPQARAAPDCKAERKRKSPSLESILNIKHGTHGLKTNPRCLEWMMGYQIGWTELKHLEMP